MTAQEMIKALRNTLTATPALLDAAADLIESMIAELAQAKRERDEMKEVLGLMVYQYCVDWSDGTTLDHRYMSAGENAFRVLGLEQRSDISTLESWLFPKEGGVEK